MGSDLTFHLGQVAILFVVALGRAFHEFEEMAQVFSFSGFELAKLNAYSERWTALGHNSGKDDAFDPDFAVGQPEAYFYRDA